MLLPRLISHCSFGFRDGVSQPIIDGIKDFRGIVDAKGVKRVSKDPKAPPTVELGKILLGRDGDVDFSGNKSTRPTWAVDGSFLCFRYLFQKVPEFNTFLKKNMPQNPEMLGSQLMGRWKSGKWLATSINRMIDRTNQCERK